MHLVQLWLERLDQPILQTDTWNLTWLGLIRLALYPLLAILIAKWVRKAIRVGLNRRWGVDRSTQNPVATVVYYLLLALGMIVALTAAGLPVQSIAVFSGAIGLGIGLGLQQVAQNFLCGVILLVTRPIRVRDWISRESLEGSVESIGVYSTIIRTLDDAEVVIPNSDLVNGILINWTRERRLRRIKLPVGVAYASDVRAVTDILLEAARASEDVVEDPPPFVQLMGYGASSVDFELVVFTLTRFATPDLLRSELYYKIWDLFQERGVQIPFTQVDLWFRNPLPGEARAT